MTGTKMMSLIIFTVINAAGVGFLLYVLAQFWREGHRPLAGTTARKRAFDDGSMPMVVVVTDPIDLELEARRDNGQLIEFPARPKNSDGGNLHNSPRSAAS